MARNFVLSERMRGLFSTAGENLLKKAKSPETGVPRLF